MKKHTLIIGGTRGSGKELARMLAERGEAVSVVGRRNVNGAELGHPGIRVCPLDITDVKQTLERIPPLCDDWSSLVFFQKYRADGDNWTGEWQVSMDATKRIVDICVDAVRPLPPPAQGDCPHRICGGQGCHRGSAYRVPCGQGCSRAHGAFLGSAIGTAGHPRQHGFAACSAQGRVCGFLSRVYEAHGFV